jgi:hypothetical protein
MEHMLDSGFHSSLHNVGTSLLSIDGAAMTRGAGIDAADHLCGALQDRQKRRGMIRIRVADLTDIDQLIESSTVPIISNDRPHIHPSSKRMPQDLTPRTSIGAEDDQHGIAPNG